MSLTTPVTECSNELTTDLDIVDAAGIVRLLRQTDSQVLLSPIIFPVP
jgi:N-acetylmuramic acid 6-phosphate (MurNAc-6-P) etherase